MKINLIKYILKTAILLFTINITAQELDCSKFKTGTFKYIKDGYQKYTIKRSDSIQVETNSENNIKIITKVEWVSKCKFILTYLDILNFERKEKVIGKKIEIEITNVNENTYKCRVNSDVINNETLEFIKIKETPD